jgi:flagellar protein FlaG
MAGRQKAVAVEPAMETGSVTKPVAVAAPVVPARADHLVAAGAVRTELAPEAAVQQAPEAQAVRFDPSHRAEARAAVEEALREIIERHLIIHPKTRDIVFQAINTRTGEIVRQIPDEALLRLRTYLRELREQEAAADGVTRVEKIA